MKTIRKITGVILGLAMILSLAANIAYAEDKDLPTQELTSEEIAEVEQEAVADPDPSEDNDDMLMRYIEFSVSTSNEAMYSTYG